MISRAPSQDDIPQDNKHIFWKRKRTILFGKKELVDWYVFFIIG